MRSRCIGVHPQGEEGLAQISVHNQPGEEERLEQMEDGSDVMGRMGMGRHWHCLRAEDGPDCEVVGPVSPDLMESLAYSPVRFDAATTIDIERSQARYSNLVVHSSRTRLQRKSKVWEEWLRVATAGRSITVLSDFPEETPRAANEGEEPAFTCQRSTAKYFLDRALTRISILPIEPAGDVNSAVTQGSVHNILVENIQVICTATDFTLFADRLESQLDEAERRRAVLLQYLKEEPKGQRRRVCFLEASAQDKERFVQALTALWLEKRNLNSICF